MWSLVSLTPHLLYMRRVSCLYFWGQVCCTCGLSRGDSLFIVRLFIVATTCWALKKFGCAKLLRLLFYGFCGQGNECKWCRKGFIGLQRVCDDGHFLDVLDLFGGFCNNTEFLSQSISHSTLFSTAAASVVRWSSVKRVFASPSQALTVAHLAFEQQFLHVFMALRLYKGFDK